MAISLSPAVTIKEVDLTNVVPAVATSVGAAVIEATWGPVLDVTTVDSENVLVQRFGKPVSGNAANWFAATNFLSYANNLLVVRSDTSNQRNAVSQLTGGVGSISISSIMFSFNRNEPNKIQKVGHGYTNGTALVFNQVNGTKDIKTNRVYYVINSAADKFEISGTVGGPAVFFTADGTAIMPLGGKNYKTAVLEIDPPMGAGTVRSVDIITRGQNYDSPPTVEFADPPPGGVKATGIAYLDETDLNNLKLDRIVITNPGYGYTETPTLSLIGGTKVGTIVATYEVVMNTGGVQATGRAVVTVPSNLSGGSNTRYGYISSIEIMNPGSGYHQENEGFYASYPTYRITDYTMGDTSNEGALAFTPLTILASNIDITLSGIKINNQSHYDANFANGEAIVGEFAAKWPGALGNSLSIKMVDNATWEDSSWDDLRSQFDGAPTTSDFVKNITNNPNTNDELHILVIDRDGKWGGVPGAVLEKFAFLSKAGNAKKEDGSGAYYKDVINSQSKYIWWMDHPVNGMSTWGQPVSPTSTYAELAAPISNDLSGGLDHVSATMGQRIEAFDLFADAESLDVNLIIVGKANSVVANYVIQNIAENRKDCMAFISPEDVSSGEILVGNTSDITEKLIAYRNALPSSSYFVIDSGFKYQYDRYNDTYRWVPLNGDIAGLCARTDATNDPWFSPAGFNRGQIKNVVKLAFNPRKTDRDNLYMKNINPVVSFPGQGVVLFGDKTGLTKPSAFDRINVRRLFIVLEKAIATSAKYQLFDLNDVQTRAQFRSTVEPFLRDVKGRRGVYDFKVICDETNNTPEVIDTNRFAASIFIKPARSINFIELSFVAVRSGVDFNEIVGAA